MIKNAVNNSDVNEVSLAKALQNETIFIAVPIRDFESLIHEFKNDIQGKKTVIDVCSVKVFPKNVMIENLSSEIDIIATHPLFGPDSLKDRGSVMTMESVSETYMVDLNFGKIILIAKIL
jgi:prephenate dehydrogenase